MNQFTLFLMNDNDTENLITIITDKQRFLVVQTLISTLQSIQLNPNINLRKSWLAVKYGDLAKKENREFKQLDYHQIKQVYEYITTILNIRLPNFVFERKYTNEHLWKFYKLHRSQIYKTTDNTSLQNDLNNLWIEYDNLIQNINKNLDENYSQQIEDIYFERGLWISEDQVDKMQKAFTKKLNYNPIIGKLKFDKLFKYHGNNRVELKKNWNKWITIVFDYGPSWLIENARKCKLKKEFKDKNKIIEILKNYNYHIQYWKSLTRDSQDVFEINKKTQTLRHLLQGLF